MDDLNAKDAEEEPINIYMEVFEEDAEQSADEDSSGLDIDTETEVGDESPSKQDGKRKRTSSNESDENETAAKKQLCSLDDLLPGVYSHIEEQMERELCAKAAKAKLTVRNVRNILKQVFTNKQVLSMVRRTVNDKENGMVEDDSCDVYVPKLTRSKTKELLATQPEMAWPMTPVKRQVIPSECQALIEQDLPEDSSDEEYQPNEEELIHVSDWDMSSEPSTPGSATTPRPPSNNDCSTQTSWTEDGAFRIPAENIGQRTRSKYSLSDTPLETIEQAFVPPDITTDMYEVECDDEEWSGFLKEFTEPLKTNANDTLDDDDEADPEYNLLADEATEAPVDKEELRMDRGVKVSRKELNLLVAELFDMYDGDNEVEEVEPTTSHEAQLQEQEAVVETTETFVSEVNLQDPVEADVNSAPQPIPAQIWYDVTPVAAAAPPSTLQEYILPDIETDQVEANPNVLFSEVQRLLLAQQMRKHVQLLGQNFVQTCNHPVLENTAIWCKAKLQFLQKQSISKENSMFNVANLDASLQLVEDWEEVMSSETGKEIKRFMIKQINKSTFYLKGKRKYPFEFPEQMMEILCETKAIVYPLLLPLIPFRCDGFRRMDTLLSEHHLMAIGLEQFIPFVRKRKSLFKKKYELNDAVELIHKYLVPGHDVKYLLAMVKRERGSSIASDTPTRYFFDNGRAPGTDHVVFPFNAKTDLKTLVQQPPEVLPDVWRKYVFPNIELSAVSMPVTQYRPIRQAFHVVNV